MSKNLIIAIDGPAGSGKSTSAKLVAQKLGYLYIDTGAMYRAVTYAAMKAGQINNPEAVTEIARKCRIDLKYENGLTNVKIDGEDVTEQIRTQEVNQKVSLVSKIKEVREALVAKQQQMRTLDCGIVMEGRDIATVVFPDADVKIFLTASIEQRAKRRKKEFDDKGTAVNVEDIQKNLQERDILDSTRDVSPLVKAEGAFEVDTSKVSIDEQVEIILDKVRQTAEQKEAEIRRNS